MTATKRSAKPRIPAGLSEPGSDLWRRLVAKYDFTPGELPIVAAACRQADDNAALEDLIERGGMITVGSTGQPRLSAAVTEVRQGRLALAKLLGQLALPDEEDGERPKTAAQLAASKAAKERWRQDAEQRARRDGARRGPAA